MNIELEQFLKEADIDVEGLREDIRQDVLNLSHELDELHQSYLDGSISFDEYNQSLMAKKNYLTELLS